MVDEVQFEVRDHPEALRKMEETLRSTEDSFRMTRDYLVMTTVVGFVDLKIKEMTMPGLRDETKPGFNRNDVVEYVTCKFLSLTDLDTNVVGDIKPVVHDVLAGLRDKGLIYQVYPDLFTVGSQHNPTSADAVSIVSTILDNKRKQSEENGSSQTAKKPHTQEEFFGMEVE